MSDVYKVRVGVSAARELELEVEETQVVIDAFEKAIKKNEPVLWIAFIEFDQPTERGVGFAP